MVRQVSQKPAGRGKPARSRALAHGWRGEEGRRLLVLENDLFRLKLWPDLGGAITSYYYKPGRFEMMWRNPSVPAPRRGLLGQPIGGGSDLFDVMDGSWYVSLPNGFFPGDYFGASLGTHGELRAVPWEVESVGRRGAELRAVLVGRSVRTPLVFRRELTLRAGSPLLFWRETLSNPSAMPLPVAWLHHPAFSGPLIEGACLIAPARRVRIFKADHPAALQLKSGYVGRWPHVPERVGGKRRDCSLVPAAGSGKDHSVQLEDFQAGWGCLWNERLGLGFAMEWDLDVFPCAWSWAHGGGGTVRYPLWGRGHLVTLQPSTSPAAPFAELRRRKQLLTVPAGGEVATQMITGFVDRPEGPWSQNS